MDRQGETHYCASVCLNNQLTTQWPSIHYTNTLCSSCTLINYDSLKIYMYACIHVYYAYLHIAHYCILLRIMQIFLKLNKRLL